MLYERSARNDGVTPVCTAAELDNVHGIRLLHEYGADMNKAKNDGAILVLVAAWNGHVDAIKVLYVYGRKVITSFSYNTNIDEVRTRLDYFYLLHFCRSHPSLSIRGLFLYLPPATFPEAKKLWLGCCFFCCF